MTRWVMFAVKTVIVCVVLVAVAGGASVAGLVAISAVSGLGPKTVIEKVVGKLQAIAGVGNAQFDRITENQVSLRGEFSTAFRNLESRVVRLEQRAGGDAPLVQPRKTMGFEKTQLTLPPMGSPPPPARFGGWTSENDLVREPQGTIPKFDYTPPATADVWLAGCKFQSLAAAYAAAKPDSSITLAPGYYPECLIVKKSLLIVGQIGPNGERAQFDSECAGKAAFVVNAAQFELRGVLIRDINPTTATALACALNRRLAHFVSTISCV
jgi:hypothetical protein